MAESSAFAAAAGAAPTIPMVGGGMMCHDTVMTWLVQIGCVSAKQVAQLYGTYSNGPAFYGKIFARTSDKQITKANAAQVPAGMICSFYTPQGLSHTMATCGQGKFAGTNNLNVGGGLDYDQIAGTEFPWSADGRKIGGNGYALHACSLADFELRFAQVSAHQHRKVAV